ncbi:MAG TPA: FAD-binding oxidoreductase [Vicinamibacterales bacterium]|nr:FAD-binding oxidoreductase [Vicinamibacterales bacterium]
MTLSADALKDFRQQHRGDLIGPDDARYEEARRVWNAMVDRRPAVIARPRGAADVIAGVQFAQKQGLPVAIRGGGHNVAGRCVCDGGLVIDFADMKAIRVDPVGRTARAEPGLRWTEFDRETQAFGLATTGGTIGDTGIAGLTLGGGFGWLEGKFGMTVDNLLGADVVLADGRLVHASSTEHPDLFWALRGGGGNFGVVTSFEYRLHEVGPLIIGGLVVHPFPRAKEVLKFFGDFLRTAPDELVAAAVLMTAPDGNKACGIAVAYPGDIAEGERLVAPIKQFGPPVMDVIGPMPYLAQQALIEAAMPPNVLNYWKAEFLRDVSGGLIDVAVDAYASAPSPMSSILFYPIRGAASRVSPDDTAFPHRRGYHFGIYSLWTDPSQNDQNIAWVRQTCTGVQSFVSGGVYVNELGEDDGVDRVEMAFGPNYDRLQRIKATYDPNNVFRLNANIAPVGV